MHRQIPSRARGLARGARSSPRASPAPPDSPSASDHQDTPDVELNPKMDMTDVYVFPGRRRRAGSCWS